jgi:hypothetical protein
MIIRAEQMSVFQSAAEERFERKLAAHLLENYGNSVVRLPETESAVSELPEEILHSLIKISIERAQSYGLTFESSISAFSALMFEAAPNFDKHNLSNLCLQDENIAPNDRINELLNLLTEEHWERIRNDYDVYAWQPDAEKAENSEEIEKSVETKNPDFAETVMNIERIEKPENPANVKNPDFDQTVMNIDNPKKPESSKNFDFMNTVLNIDSTEEKN